MTQKELTNLILEIESLKKDFQVAQVKNERAGVGIIVPKPALKNATEKLSSISEQLKQLIPDIEINLGIESD